MNISLSNAKWKQVIEICKVKAIDLTRALQNTLAGGGIVIYKYKGSTITEHFFRLGTGPTLFQAELLAIANLCDIFID